MLMNISEDEADCLKKLLGRAILEEKEDLEQLLNTLLDRTNEIWDEESD